jgi:hypothetical protein
MQRRVKFQMRNQSSEDRAGFWSTEWNFPNDFDNSWREKWPGLTVVAARHARLASQSTRADGIAKVGCTQVNTSRGPGSAADSLLAILTCVQRQTP